MKQIAIRLPVDMLEAVDAIVAERYGQADRTQVMRELIAQSLAARGLARKKS
jgi:metal-responsive CopG/Arc/MetJ family transcriptional regulator